MSENAFPETDPLAEIQPPGDVPPPELPPVEPPSAGFILQLFFVPAVIVLVVVGVWALFGKLATSEQDWEKLLAEVGSQNPHVRWRAALGLAQLLSADQELGSRGQGLAHDPRVARGLVNLFSEQFRRRSDVTEDDVKQLEFLARTLGMLDVPEVTLPALGEAIRIDGHHRDVRRTAIASVALIAGRARERDQPLDVPELTDDLIAVSSEDDPMLRQMGAFTLGLLEGDAARRRLVVLLDDRDAKTRMNAAVGLARHNSTQGYSVFRDVLQQSSQRITAQGSATRDPASSAELAQAQFEEPLMLRNTLLAIEMLADELTAAQRSELASLLEPIAQRHREPTLRLKAGHVLKTLTGAHGE